MGCRDSFGGEAHLGGVRGQVIGGVQMEVCDVPEPAWMDRGTDNKRMKYRFREKEERDEMNPQNYD